MAFNHPLNNTDELLAQSLAMEDYMDFHEKTTPHHESVQSLGVNASHTNSICNTNTINPKPSPKIVNQKCLPSILTNYISSKSVINLSDDINATNPDIYNLFFKYNYLYFDNKLSGCEVKWSKRMTLCAGLCCYEGHGGLCSIKLSSALLKYRSTQEMIETLIHEMIHAFLFVTFNDKDRKSHGDRFKSMMNAINYVSSLNISIYHTFHDEVDAHRKHIWKCKGPCQHKPPYFGLVKRAMNRAPGPNDNWWTNHKRVCGGIYVKISEPKEFTEKQRKKKEREERKKLKEEMKKNGMDIKRKKKKLVGGKKRKREAENVRTLVDMFGGNRDMEPAKKMKRMNTDKQGCESDIEILDCGMNNNNNNNNEEKVQCPVCQQMYTAGMINLHLDACLP